ncbi:MAG TPA: hypothetical protein VMX54_14455 [Vicinamibacteria bacterium]|nr:hypothetical protein [Vicinamibacteria bacterium]
MCRPPASRALLAAGLLACAATARSAAVLDVAGTVVATEPRLQVRVQITNRGDQPAPGIEVAGELLGVRDQRRLYEILLPGASDALWLSFDVAPPRPGVYALTLLLEHPLPGTPDAAGNPPLASQRAWLLVALGANPSPAIRLSPRPLRLRVSGRLDVSVESADATAHRVRLRALTARGLRTEGEPPLIEVPATGSVRARLELMRAGAPPGTRHGVLLVAETLDGPLARSTVAMASVDVAPDPSLLPHWRTTLLVLALILLAVAIGAEAWRGLSGWRRA